MKGLHITTKEATASAWTLQRLLHHIPDGAGLEIQSDSTPTVYAWRKGSRVQRLNRPIRYAYRQACTRGIFITSSHIAGQLNTRADWLSRNRDPKSYQEDPQVFRRACAHLCWEPTVDLFANRHNRHPLPFRLQHLQAALTQPHLSAQHRALLTQSIKRLTRARKGAKYPNFYPLTPLINLAFDPSSDRT